MNKLLAIASLSIMCGFAVAQEAEAPKSLWNYDKSNFTVGDINADNWRVSDVDGKVTENGFAITKLETKGGGAVIRYVALNQSHPYFCFKILNSTRCKDNYFSLYTPAIGYFAAPTPVLVHKVPAGYYSFKGNIAQDKPMTTCRFDMHGGDVEFAFMGMFDKPEYILYTNDNAMKIGDELVINFDSLKPVDAVAVELIQAYTMPPLAINGKSKIELTAVNAEKTKWQAKVKLESVTPHVTKKPYTPGTILLKTTVNNQDIYGTNYGTIQF
jgi:hypothetical protein